MIKNVYKKIFPGLFFILVLLTLYSSLFTFHCFAENLPGVVWQRLYDGGSDDFAEDVAIDSVGNIYITGWSQGTNRFDCVTIKYNKNGDLIWQRRYDKGKDDIGSCITVDDTGNVYVAGYTVIDTAWNYFVIKYDTTGNEKWSKTRFTWPWGEMAYGISVDDTGNVYVTGHPDTVKYNSNGDLIWEGSVWGDCITIDDTGYFYVSGSITIGQDKYYRTYKYNSNTSNIWTKDYKAGSTGSDVNPHGIAVDRIGNVCVTGKPVTLKYDSGGNLLWNINESYEDVAVDSATNIYLLKELLFSKYSSEKVNIWQRAFSGNGKGITIDNVGNIIVTGSTTSKPDYLTIKYRMENIFGIDPVVERGEVKIGSTGGRGIVYPNNGEKAIISFRPTNSGTVIISIYSLNGLLVKRLTYETLGATDPNNFVYWACNNTEENAVSSGIYLVHVEGPGINVTKKVVILR